jgi:hypothetical protein
MEWGVMGGRLRIDDGGLRIARTLAMVAVALLRVVPCTAQDKVRFPIGASSKPLATVRSGSAKNWVFFEREGLDVQIVVMRGTPITLQALATESIYAANVGTDGVIGAVDKGLDLAMIGSLLNNLSMSLVAAKPYKTFDDLRGKTIGSQTITTGTGFAMRLVLRAPWSRISARLSDSQHRRRYRSLCRTAIRANRRDAVERAPRYFCQAAGLQRDRLLCR